MVWLKPDHLDRLLRLCAVYSFTCVSLFYAKVLDNKPISKQCDVYSYGIVVWELLTHKIPFEDTVTYHELHKVVVKDKKVSNLYS